MLDRYTRAFDIIDILYQSLRTSLNVYSTYENVSERVSDYRDMLNDFKQKCLDRGNIVSTDTLIITINHAALQKIADEGDNLYRSVLKYRTIQNTGSCTFDDIMLAIKTIWNTTDIKYYENPERPGVIYILLPSVGIDEMDPADGRVLSLRPSGVNVVYSIDYDVDIGRLVEMKADVPRMMMTSYIGPSELWRLDGEHTLDGSHELDGVPRTETYPSFSVGMINEFEHEINANAEMAFNISNIVDMKADIPKSDIHSYVGYSELWRLDGEYSLDGEMTVDGIPRTLMYTNYSDIGIIHGLGMQEDIEVGLITRKNIWCLDGSYMLDGIELINAKITEEVL